MRVVPKILSGRDRQRIADASGDDHPEWSGADKGTWSPWFWPTYFALAVLVITLVLRWALS